VAETTAYFKNFAKKLAENGYQVVPAEGKRVLLWDWTSYQLATGDAERYPTIQIGSSMTAAANSGH